MSPTPTLHSRRPLHAARMPPLEWTGTHQQPGSSRVREELAWREAESGVRGLQMHEVCDRPSPAASGGAGVVDFRRLQGSVGSSYRKGDRRCLVGYITGGGGVGERVEPDALHQGPQSVDSPQTPGGCGPDAHSVSWRTARGREGNLPQQAQKRHIAFPLPTL